MQIKKLALVDEETLNTGAYASHRWLQPNQRNQLNRFIIVSKKALLNLQHSIH